MNLLPTSFLSTTCCRTQVHSLPRECAFLLPYMQMAILEQVIPLHVHISGKYVSASRQLLTARISSLDLVCHELSLIKYHLFM